MVAKKKVKELTKKTLTALINKLEKAAMDEENIDEYEQGLREGISNTLDEIRDTFGLVAPDPEIYKKYGCKPGEPFDPDKYPAGDGCEGCTKENREDYRCEGCEVGFDDGETD